MNYLVVVAHPDDEILGAGATIHKLIEAGNKVAVAIMVSQAAARKDLSLSLSEDEAEALSVVGVQKTLQYTSSSRRWVSAHHTAYLLFGYPAMTD